MGEPAPAASGLTRTRALDLGLASALVLLVCGSLAWFGWLEWPGLHWDSDLFASALMNVAHGKGWTFDSYSQFLIKRTSNSYNFHGILQVWFYAVLLRVRDWPSLTLAMAAVNVASYLLYTALFVQTRRLRQSSGLRWCSAALLALVPAVVCLGLQGRPEQLAVPLLAIPWLQRQARLPHGCRLLIDGLTLGALMLVSPLVGLMAGMILLVLLSLDRSRTLLASLRDAITSGVVALLFAALAFSWITPFRFLDWIGNLRSSGTTVPLNWVIRNVDTLQWGTSMLAPFWGLVIGAAALILLAKLASLRRWPVLLLAAGAVVWVGSRGIDYSYTPFLPGVMLLWLDQRLQIRRSHDPVARFCQQQLPLLFAATYGLILVQQLAFSTVVFRDGGSPAAARELLRSITGAPKPKQELTLATTMAMARAGVVLDAADKPTLSIPWSTSAETEVWPFWSLHRFERRFPRRVEFFVLQQPQPQTGVYEPPPPKIYLDRDEPFVLIHNGWRQRFNAWERRLRPARLGNAYWLAVYRRTAPPPAVVNAITDASK